MKIVTIEWTETHTYAAFVEVPDNFDRDDYDVSTALAEINYDEHHTGCTERDVTDIDFDPKLPRFPNVEEIDWESHKI